MMTDCQHCGEDRILSPYYDGVKTWMLCSECVEWEQDE